MPLSGHMQPPSGKLCHASAPAAAAAAGASYCWRRWGFVTGNLPQKNKSERKGNVRRRDKEGVFGPQLHGKNNTLRRRRFGDRTIARPLLGEECLQLPCRRPVLNQRTLPTGSPDPSRVAGGRCKTAAAVWGHGKTYRQQQAVGRARWSQTDSAGLFPAAYDATALY